MNWSYPVFYQVMHARYHFIADFLSNALFLRGRLSYQLSLFGTRYQLFLFYIFNQLSSI